MRLFYNQKDNIFFCQSSYEEKEIPKSAGFLWNPISKRWETRDIKKAMKLKEFAEGIALEKINEKINEIERAIAMSKQTNAEINIPKPNGLEYLPFQKAGIAYALERDNTLIADEMGLGKTIQAIGYVNCICDEYSKILIICPATLKLNWKRELERWLVAPLSIDIANSKYFPATNIVIINYDIIAKMRKEIDKREWDVLICDESHYLKNQSAQRTIAVFGNRRKLIPGIKAKKKLFLTGTPILNRPVELFSLLNYLNLPFAKSFWDFASKYCGAYKTKYGWTFDGATNLSELQENLRSTIMIRRLKSQVLSELPAKRRQIIEILSENGYTDILKEENKIIEKYGDIEKLLNEYMTDEEYRKCWKRVKHYGKGIFFRRN